ncbi:PspC domain-containing protein [Planomonospora sp. ID82291]|uniref:PspC domain-containing protein n=1 Tax=Planomonospora sp. ID82291 TaxID=2738136 RepID=UPI0018C429F7|nr:PspC domain-containing protein [Planomonospora sp. ID82291]MBG0814663.1 PspC domain-containing protein [Planomonospora sp. ID82291]
MNENDFSGIKQLRRTRDGRIVAGVASGLGRYVGIDPNIIRAVLAASCLFGGLGLGVYAIGWLLLPEEGKETSILQDLVNNNKDNPVWQDARAKAEQGWAKAERSWNDRTGGRSTGYGPDYPVPPQDSQASPYAGQHPAPYPTHQDPAQPYPASVPPRGEDESKPQA